MKTLCIIGNSHLAAIKLGWMTIRDEFPDVEIIFFGAPGKNVEDIKLAEGKLVAIDQEAAKKFKRLSGRSSISGEYDGYVVCDLGIRIRVVVDFCCAYRAEKQVVDQRIPVSEGCLQLALLGSFRNTFAVTTIAQLRKITTAPIALIHAPLPSPEHPNPVLRTLEDNGEDAFIASAFGAALRVLAKELAIHLFLAPRTLLASPLRTKPTYTRAHSFIENDISATIGNIGMDLIMDDEPRTDMVENDYNHMNGHYGAIVLRQILENLKLDRVPPVSIMQLPVRDRPWWRRKLSLLLRRVNKHIAFFSYTLGRSRAKP